MNFSISKHAEEEMFRRQISLKQVEALMDHPDQIVEAHGGLVCYQCLSTKDGKPGLLRAIINEAKPGVILDYDIEGNIVGLEILNASKRVDNPKAIDYALAS